MCFYIRKIGICLLCAALLAGCASAEPKTSDDSKSVQEQYRPSELALTSQEKYTDVYMGIEFTLPQKLMELMDSKEVAMLSNAQVTEDGSSIRYALYTWNTMTKEQREAFVPSKGNGFYEWADGLDRIGAIGVYQTDQLEKVDSLTKCTEHQQLGKSEDGLYTYYLSVNPNADEALTKLVKQIQAHITEMDDGTQASRGNIDLGAFSLEDISGKTYTNQMFENHKLTMVNAFTTWCSPCINEIPDLEKLHKEMSGQGVNVVGIVLDAVGMDGSKNEEAVEKAKILAERIGVSYPFLIPDASGLNGRLTGIDAVPETFFVDSTGTIVGETYAGSHSLEDWKKIIETELGRLEGDQP